MKMKRSIDDASVKLMENDAKIGVLATEDEQGCPHLTFISSIQALGNQQISWGRFAAGLSKQFIEARPDAGFLALTADMQFLSGLAHYTYCETAGPLFDAYNAKPLFRYNTYMGFSRVYCMDLIGITPIQRLNMPAIVCGSVLSRIRSPFAASSRLGAMPHIAKALFSELASLKFIAWYDDAHQVRIVPIVQAAPAGSDRIVFSSVPFGEELRQIPNNAQVAVLCLNLNMESVLVKGRCQKGTVQIERVYNAMPPKMEYVYPRDDAIKPVTSF